MQARSNTENHSMSAWLPLFAFLLSVSAWAKAIDCQTDACLTQTSDLSSIELTAETRASYLKSQIGTILEIPALDGHCNYRKQEVIISNRNSEGLPLWWGRASIQDIRKNKSATTLRVSVLERSLTDSLVAPDCTERCHRVISKLPSSQSAKIFDVRPAQMTSTIPLPGITRLTGTYSAATIASVLGSNLEQRLIFMTQNNQLTYARPLLQIMQTAYRAGYKNIEWYYPGVQGFRGWYLPSSPPVSIRTVGVEEARNAVKKAAVFAFVPDVDGHIVTALNSGSSMRRVPWKSKKFRVKEFDFSFLPQRKETPIIFVQKDATAVHVYDAATASRTAGYTDVSVLPGGVYELEIVR